MWVESQVPGNWLWWPDAKMRAAGMAVVGKDMTRPLVDWVSPELTVELPVK